MKTVYENDYVIVMDTGKCACSLKDGTYLFQIPLRFFNSTFSHRPQCTLLSPLKFCITMVFFSLGTTALEKMVMQNFGGINKVHYGLCNNDEGGRAKTIKKRNVWMQIF